MKIQRSRRNFKSRRHAEGLAVTTLLCAAGNLAAQTPAAPQNTNPAPTETKPGTDLPTVVVTDSADYKPAGVTTPKYTEPLRDIPQTITVIPDAVMKEQSVTTLRDVLRNVSGISLQGGEGSIPAGDNLVIRGFTASTDIFVDGIRDIGGYTRDPFNIEQVEVAKGPSSANGGRGSTGGSINLVSKTPQLQPFYTGSMGAGSDAYFRVTADVNQPLGDGMAMRLNAMWNQSDVPGSDALNNKRFGIAPSLAFGLGTDTRLIVSFFHMDEDNIPSFGIPWVPATVNVTNPDGTRTPVPMKDPRFTPYINKAAPVDYSNFYGIVGRDYEKTRTDIATITFDHDFSSDFKVRDEVRFGNVTRDSVMTAPRFTATNPSQITRQFQSKDLKNQIWENQTDFTIKFDTGPLKHTVVTGLDLAHEEGSTHARAESPAVPLADPFNPDPFIPYTSSVAYTGAYGDTRVTTVGVYGFDTIKLGEHWELTGGVRYDHINEYNESIAANHGANTHISRTDGLVSTRAALVYKPVREGSIYFSYGTSFNPASEAWLQGLNNPGNTNTDPEKTESFELGTKWEVIEEKLSINASLFHTDKTNARTPDPTDPTIFTTAGAQRVQGIDLGFGGNITDKWRIIGSYTYLKTELRKSNLATDIIGAELANAPQNSFNLWTVYDLPAGFQVGFGTQYVGQRYNATTTSRREAPSYEIFNAMVGYKVTDRLSLQVNLNNLADKRYIDQLGDGQFIPGVGRNVTVTANFKF